MPARRRRASACALLVPPIGDRRVAWQSIASIRVRPALIALCVIFRTTVIYSKAKSAHDRLHFQLEMGQSSLGR